VIDGQLRRPQSSSLRMTSRLMIAEAASTSPRRGGTGKRDDMEMNAEGLCIASMGQARVGDAGVLGR